jgi:hypothetical protein
MSAAEALKAARAAGVQLGADGTGLAMTRLSDQAGACGRAWQTLLVAPRQ